MSLVGHGAMGVASNLPTLEELLESSAADRRHVVELRPGILVTDWFLHSGTAYVAALQPMFDGRRLDIVDVVSLLDTGLSRAETLADCIATAGTFFFDPDVDTEDAFIWNSTNWDDGKFWDRFPRLFVHLENGSNPRDTQVLARVVFFVAGRGAVVPDLGPDKLGDGDFEGTWSGGAPPGWTKVEDGSGAVSEETADPIGGSKSVGLALGADAGVAAVLKTLDVEVGAQYRVTARYRTGAQNRLGSGLLDGSSFAAVYELESDGAGFGPTLTEVNSPTYAAAVQGDGAQLTKVTDNSDSPHFKLAAASAGDFDPGTDSFVVAVKARHDSLDSSDQYASKGADGSAVGWSLLAQFATQARVASFFDGVNSVTVGPAGAVVLGAFASVVVSVDRAQGIGSLYENGVLVATADISALGSLTDASTDLFVGANAGATFTLDGRIDQVVFLRGRAWSAADVLEYHAAVAGSPPGPWAPSTLQIRVGSGAAGWLSEDGRSHGTARYGATLDRTSARERVATFDFVAHTAAPSLRLELIGAGAATATLDAVELRRIWRWHFARPRLLAGAMPSSSQGQQDTFFGSDVIGQGEVGLANGDALMEQLLGAFDWLSADVRVHQGGVMPDGRELPFCHYLRRFTGRVEDIPTDAVTDRDVRLPLEDLKGLLHRDAPPNTYDLAAFPSMIAAKAGEPRPLWLGPKTNVSPVRIIRDPDTGYGTYELADPTVSPAGLKAVDAVYAYLDETAAREKVSARRLTLSSGTDYSADLATCRLTILRDVQVIEVTAEANLLDFDVGGSALLATLTPGLYIPATLAAEAETRLDAAAGVSDISVTYDEELHRFTVAKAAGTLNLLADSGANTELSGWGVLGFDRSADKSGLLSYQGDLTDPLFNRDEGADVRHILRVDGKGYKDDGAGTYTGAGDALITIGADIARFAWHQLMRQPLARFDETAAAAARISHPENLGVYLAGRTSTRSIFEALKASNLAQIVIGGDGTLYYVPYTSTVPATAPALRDRDFTRWQAGQPRADVHPEVVVLYDEDPTTSARRSRRATDESIRLVAGRLSRHELETYHTTDDGAQLTANRAQALSSARPWVADVVVPSRLARRRPQEFVLVTRSRGLGGPFTDEAFRIVWMQHGRQTEARLVQNVEI